MLLSPDLILYCAGLLHMMFETLIYLDQFEMTNLDQIKIVHCKTGHNDVHKFCFICSYVLYACTISILVFQG